METQIQIKINNKEKDLIKKASEIIAVGYSTLCRQASVERAREILLKNKPMEAQN